jgi:hypothetical protein
MPGMLRARAKATGRAANELVTSGYCFPAPIESSFPPHPTVAARRACQPGLFRSGTGSLVATIGRRRPAIISQQLTT